MEEYLQQVFDSDFVATTKGRSTYEHIIGLKKTTLELIMFPN